MGPTWGSPGSCRPQTGPMLDPWTLLVGNVFLAFLLSTTLAISALSKSLRGVSHIAQPQAFSDIWCDKHSADSSALTHYMQDGHLWKMSGYVSWERFTPEWRCFVCQLWAHPCWYSRQRTRRARTAISFRSLPNLAMWPEWLFDHRIQSKARGFLVDQEELEVTSNMYTRL